MSTGQAQTPTQVYQSRVSSSSEVRQPTKEEAEVEVDEEVDEVDEEEEEEEDEEEDDDDVAMNQRAYSPSTQDNSNAEMEIDDEADRASDSSFSDSVSMSSSPSIPSSDDIDFTLVYALHTFLATVDGQASVVKGDQLTLLDDSNSYWWLIRVLKTQAVGYIPAENIETPYERLARLNKHRNVDLSSATPNDHISGPGSSLAQTRFSQRIPSAGDPVRSRSPQDRRKGPLPPPMPGPGHFSPPPVAPAPGTGKGKTVAFTAPTYFENSGNEWSEDGEGESGDEEMMSGDEEEGEEGEWDGEGEFGDEGEEGFEDEEEETEEEDEDEEDQEGYRPGPDAQRQLEDQLAQEHKQQLQLRQQQQQQQQQSGQDPSGDEASKGGGPSGWARLRLAAKASADSLRGSKDDGRSQLGKGMSPAQRAQIEPSGSRDITPQSQPRPNTTNPVIVNTQSTAPLALNAGSSAQSRPASVNTPKKSHRSFEEALADDETKPRSNSLSSGETKKLTLTPDIARDSQDGSSLDGHSGVSSPQRNIRQRTSSGSSVEASASIRKFTPTGPYIREEDENLTGSNEGHSQSLVSVASFDSSAGAGGSEDGRNSFGKRSILKKDKRDDESDGKKKKGILSGLFGRKKDKKSNKGGSDAGEDAVGQSELDRASSSSSPSEQSSLATHSPPIRDSTLSGASGSGSIRRTRAGTSDLFSTDAALKKQQAEAQEVMYRQYGISRTPSDTTNTTVFSSTGKPPLQISPQNSSLQQLASKAVGNGPLSPLSPIGSLNGLGSPPFSASQKRRPGSLIGSPSIPGMEVPMLSVLRVFAGENVDAEATFKTVLLSAQTTTNELIVQAMQRFHLPSEPEQRLSYYLTIKDVVSGEENKIDETQLPLKVFEAMNEAMGQDGLMLPSVKRSSVGSISSISSNLSLNPAISRLGMSDFSDDSAVKFYINSYGPDGDRNIPKKAHIPTRKNERTGVLEPIQEDAGLNGTTDDNSSDKDTIVAGRVGRGPELTDARLSQVSNSPSISSSGTAEQVISPTTSPSLRFAMRIQIYPSDLPDGVVFDPQSNAIIPKHVLNERGKRTSSNSSTSSNVSLTMREKVMLFPRNINVSEAIEHALEVFGISEGVVDGGDDVEEKVSKRRSVSKVRYGLSVKLPNNSSELPVQLTSKVLDTYITPPTFRPPDRTSKESRRRSQEGSFVFGSLLDLQTTDPVFILRRATPSYPNRRESLRSSTGLAGAVADELGLMLKKSGNRSSSTNHQRIGSLTSQKNAPLSAQTLVQSQAIASGTTAEMIAAQRAAFLSASRNSEQGVDITLNDHTTIRSKRSMGEENYRYSYIDPAGAEFDISELIEAEWSSTLELNLGTQAPQKSRDSNGKLVGNSSQNSLSSMTEDGYASAPESPVVTAKRFESPTALDEEEEAIEALKLAPLTIEKSSAATKARDNKRKDLLMAALDKQKVSKQSDARLSRSLSQSSEPLEKRIERVLAKVKASRSGTASQPHSIKHSRSSNPTLAKELGPRVETGTMSATSRAQPFSGTPVAASVHEIAHQGHNRPSSIDQILSSARLQSSINSSRSNSTTGTNSPTTPISATSPSTYTPISSATRGVGIDSRQSNPTNDFGLEVLMNLVHYSTTTSTSPTPIQQVRNTRQNDDEEIKIDEIFGRNEEEEDYQKNVINHNLNERDRSMINRLNGIENRLDQLMIEILNR
ncbi:hypothetical protein CROQUDRAFT_725843 [Cronartium quercuum f. sp. fusiforme G11]|uniref:SH3 domain-containing protein n=1 Tax=Cronartium quercuum f. sp. fusiforme G11 TaxID=708437 RepID=A0A9P6N835_9BASI|nr:hypothetical protein CROQUDRAFT_725843 [Cronartium quercuum f. sp. fusiforme G11]